MSLRFIIGAAGTGKTSRCMQEILQKQSASHQVLLVPEQFTSQAEHDLVAKTNGQAILNQEVLSFGRLAYRIFSKSPIGRRLPMNEIGKNMALQKILLQKKEDFIYFQNSLDKAGFVDQLALTVSELAQYEIPAESLYITENDVPEGTKSKAHDLAQIYEAYQEFLAQDYLSPDTSLGLLSDCLKQEKGLFADTSFWLDGFNGFTPQELSIIRELMRLSPCVTITLPMDQSAFLSAFLPASAPFYTAYATKQSLIAIATENGVPIGAPVFLNENLRSHAMGLKNLEANFFYGFYKKCGLTDGVQIFSAPTPQDEASFAAGKIVSLAREHGIRYREMAIVTNAMEQYENHLRTTLRQYDIPYFIDSRRDISAHPLISFVRGLFDLLVYDFGFEGMLSYLKSGITPLAQDNIDQLENYILAYGIKGYKWRKEEWMYGRKKNGENDEEIAHMNALHGQIMEWLSPFLAFKKNTEYSVHTFIEALVSHLEQLGVSERLTNWAEESTEHNDLARAEEHRQIWDMLMEVVSTADTMLGESKMTLASWTKILDAGLDKCSMGVIPPAKDCVLVGDIERSRLPEIKYLFVLGVNEGVLPSPAQAQGIFTEQERELLTQKGLQLAPSLRSALFEEQFLIYRGLTRPSEGLYLSFANGDMEGKALFPSSLIDKFCRMDTNLKIAPYHGFTLDESTPASAFSSLGMQMKDTQMGEAMHPIWQDIYSFFAEDANWKAQLALLRDGLVTNKKQERLAPKTTKALYSDNIFSSVSRLERFASCPFAYFAEYGLKAKERQLYQLHTPDLGLLFHEVLEIFSNEIETQSLDWQTLDYQQTQSMIEQAVDDAAPRLANEILLDSAANQYLIGRLKRISTRAAWTLVTHMQSGGFTIGGYEVGFGFEQALPPIQIALSDGSILTLSGKIDRVDFLDAKGNRYVKVIDYKSGAKAFDFQDIYYGLQLQLLVYLDAYLKYYEKTETPMKPGGVFYFRIADPTIALDAELSAEEIQAMLYEKMKMSGLALADESVLSGLDHVFESKGLAGTSSAIVPVGFTKKGEPSATANLATEAQYADLLSFVVKQTVEIGDDMKKGVIAPNPYKKGQQTPCAYCSYRSICRHDYEDNPQWRNLKSVSKAEFWERLENDASTDADATTLHDKTDNN